MEIDSLKKELEELRKRMTIEIEEGQLDFKKRYEAIVSTLVSPSNYK